MEPTSEQTAIISAARDTTFNLTLNALAGTGKSTTLRMIEREVPAKPILYLAFNKRIVDEIAFNSKAPSDAKRMTSTTTVRTFNSLGHRMWAQYLNGNLTLNSKKSSDILREVINELPKKEQAPLWDSFWEVISGVSLAKALGYVPEGKFENAKRLISQSAFHARLEERPDDLIADLIDLVLTRSIAAAFKRTIDYNDQVYMPATFGANYPQFPLVLVDEAQDLNPVNHEMLSRLVKDRRIMLVGDPNQSIYKFRGAMQSGMQTLSSTHATSPLDLSISFRCPSIIVENARWRVPHFSSIREGGHVSTLNEASFSSFPDGCAILCRNNAPLFRLAMQFLSNGRSVSVAGSDIGPKLVANMRKLGPEEITQGQTLSAIDEWEAERIAKGSESAKDLAECMRVFAGHGTSLGQAIAYAEHLFKQTGTIRLMTGHKAKGLEFETVFILDRHLIRMTEEQDQNLAYVMETRSMENLFYIDSLAIHE
jgi:DNA helicase II / ATP-dependent DNA helicase PcrA